MEEDSEDDSTDVEGACGHALPDAMVEDTYKVAHFHLVHLVVDDAAVAQEVDTGNLLRQGNVGMVDEPEEDDDHMVVEDDVSKLLGCTVRWAIEKGVMVADWAVFP